MPKDSIGIYNMSNGSLDKIANIKSFKLPEKWSGYIGYTYESGSKKDTTKKKLKKKIKKASSKNGYPLVIHNLNTGDKDTIPYVTSYSFAKEAEILSYITTGIDDSINAGVYVINLKKSLKNLKMSK